MPDEDVATETTARWYLSDGFLGALIVLLTAATAFSAYQSAITSIEGDDLDFEAQKTLVLATSSFLNGNAELFQDVQAYDAYRLASAESPAEATAYQDRLSDLARAGLERPDGPFDDEYLTATYAEAKALIDQVAETEAQANAADDKARVFELSGLIFTIGLALTAWASLVDENRRICLVFLIIAVVCLIAGMGVILRSMLVLSRVTLPGF